jgi:phosphatidylinositol alpha-1,6-mannosyltransferase
LVVIGEEASDALHTGAGSERERIEAAARQAGVMENIQFSGRCTEQQLHEAYQGAQLHVFPVLELPGDVEGFGMVALESAAHGLRTVAFAVGGVPDAVEPGVTGRLVASGDYSGFADAVAELLRAPPAPAEVLACRAFAADKDWSRFGDRLRLLLEDSDASRR